MTMADRIKSTHNIAVTATDTQTIFSSFYWWSLDASFTLFSVIYVYIEFLPPYSWWSDGWSSLIFSMWSVISMVGYSRGSQASRASCGLVSPKGVWCIWLSCSGGLPCGRPLFVFLLHAQISSYLHWALAFPGSCLIHWVFAYVSVWTGTLFLVPDSLCSERFSSLPRAIVHFSAKAASDLWT